MISIVAISIDTATHYTSWWITLSCRSLLPRLHQNTTTTSMPPHQHQSDASKERQIQLALKVLKPNFWNCHHKSVQKHLPEAATVSTGHHASFHVDVTPVEPLLRPWWAQTDKIYEQAT
jgi:hypothetical protein